MKTSKLLVTSLLAAATMSATAFAWTTGADGLPVITDFPETESRTESLTLEGNTVYKAGSGSTTSFSIGDYDLVLDSLSNEGGSGKTGEFTLTSVSGGAGGVWFKSGSWKLTNDTTISATGDLYLQGGQFWVNSGKTIANNVYLGTSSFVAPESELARSALRIGAEANLEGTTTVLSEGTNIAFQGGALNITKLSGSGDITTSRWGTGTRVITVANAENFTGTISLANEVQLNWSSSTATFGGLSGSGSVAGGSNLNIKDAQNTTFTGTVGASGNGVALDVSGTGTQEFSGTSWFSTVSVGNAADASGGFTMVALSGATNVSDTITVKNLSWLNIAESGSLDFNTMSIETGGAVTLAGTVKINSASDRITIASNGSLTVVQPTVVFDIASSLFPDGAATLTIASGSGSFSNWNKLETKNFTVDGAVISGRSEVDSSTNGQVSITLGTAANLVWAGTAAENGNIWDENNAENKIWTNSALSTEDRSDAFYTNDNVTFNAAAANKTVSIGGNLKVGTITVSADGYMFSATDNATIKSGAITVTAENGLTLAAAQDKTLTITGAITGANASTNTSLVKTGAGTVNAAATGNRVSTIDVQGGVLQYGSGNVSNDNKAENRISSIKIASGARLEILNNDLATWSGTTYDIAGTLALGGNRFSINSGTLTFREGGEISGAGDREGYAVDIFSNNSYQTRTTTINVEGNFKISANMAVRDTSTIADFVVADGKTLTVTGTLKTVTDNNGGEGVFKKSGRGSLAFNGTMADGSRLEIASGEGNTFGGTMARGSVLSITGGKLTVTAGQSNVSTNTTVSGGGELVLGAAFSGAGKIVLNGGQLSWTTGNYGLNKAISVGAEGGKINVLKEAQGIMTLAADKAIEGTGTLTFNMASGKTFVLDGSRTVDAALVVNTGTLQFGNGTSGLTVNGNGSVELNGATLAFSGGSNTSSTHNSFALDITLKGAGNQIKWNDSGNASAASAQNTFSGDIVAEAGSTTTLTGQWAKDFAITGNLSGSGELTFHRYGENENNNYNINSRLTIAGTDNSGFSGTIVLDGKTTAKSQGLDLKGSLENGTVRLVTGTGTNAEGAFIRVLQNATVKRIEGDATSRIGIGDATAGANVGACTLTIGEGDFAGTIEDNGYKLNYGAPSTKANVTGGVLSIVKNTEGTLTLSGTNTFTGGVTIEQGVLAAANAAALGNANNSVKLSGGQLKVSGVTLNQTAITVVLSGDNYTANAALVGTNRGALAAGTTVTVGLADEADLTALGIAAGTAVSYSIWDATLANSGASLELSEAFESMLAAAGWTSSISGGTLTITAIPEPSVFGLLAGLGALALAGTRRRRKKA